MDYDLYKFLCHGNIDKFAGIEFGLSVLKVKYRLYAHKNGGRLYRIIGDVQNKDLPSINGQFYLPDRNCNAWVRLSIGLSENIEELIEKKRMHQIKCGE